MNGPTHIDREPDDTPPPGPLAGGLRDLRGDVPPERDLWPGIAARLAPRAPAPAATPRRDRRARLRRRNAGYAAAAAVVVGVALGWQLLPVRTPGPQADVGAPPGTVASVAGVEADAPLLRAADALAREYQGALREVRTAAPGPVSGPAAGLDADLERRAAEIRTALARDPDALHLFHRLHRIYAHRLALSLRQA